MRPPIVGHAYAYAFGCHFGNWSFAMCAWRPPSFAARNAGVVDLVLGRGLGSRNAHWDRVKAYALGKYLP